eukprot:31068-Pelagococcus_subviridis.AAC.5
MSALSVPVIALASFSASRAACSVDSATATSSTNLTRSLAQFASAAAYFFAECSATYFNSARSSRSIRSLSDLISARIAPSAPSVSFVCSSSVSRNSHFSRHASRSASPASARRAASSARPTYGERRSISSRLDALSALALSSSAVASASSALRRFTADVISSSSGSTARRRPICDGNAAPADASHVAPATRHTACRLSSLLSWSEPAKTLETTPWKASSHPFAYL